MKLKKIYAGALNLKNIFKKCIASDLPMQMRATRHERAIVSSRDRIREMNGGGRNETHRTGGIGSG
ncbi:hypothetical protein [Burkholderia sp. Bp8992]|uniref:hypothetical protein n=1 Tax=Burkholderia sp. Bp8992 TaxID=2184554 RepID=UPI000F587A60|nr:hypothetical protein [Burkholderia sp. Bp8992]